jgi:hypothetical protein
MVVVAGNIRAAPIPSRSDQPMKSMKTLTLRAAVVVPMPYMMTPAKKVFFLPKTSWSLLPVSMKEAIVSAYIAIKA